MTGTFICECGFVTRDIKEFNKHSCKKFKPNSPQSNTKSIVSSSEDVSSAQCRKLQPEDTPEGAFVKRKLGVQIPQSSGTQNQKLKKAQEGWDKEADKIRNQGFDLSTKMFYVKLPNDFMVSRKDVREFIKKIKEDFKNKNKMHDWEVDEIIDALAGADLK